MAGVGEFSTVLTSATLRAAGTRVTFRPPVITPAGPPKYPSGVHRHDPGHLFPDLAGWILYRVAYGDTDDIVQKCAPSPEQPSPR